VPNDIQKLPLLTPLTVTARAYEAPTAAAMMIAHRIGAMTISAKKRGTTRRRDGVDAHHAQGVQLFADRAGAEV